MSEQEEFRVLPNDWIIRLARAHQLSAESKECAMCGGTGGWPGLQKFVDCIPCGGSGVACAANPSSEKSR